MVKKELTAKQHRIWSMAQPVDQGGRGMKYADIAAELGISIPVVGKTLVACRKKMGIFDARKTEAEQKRMDVSDPERFAGLMDAASEPEKLMVLQDALKACGISGKAAEAYVRRIRRRYPGVLGVSKALKTNELIDKLDHRINATLDAMDEHVILEASFRDLALGATAMIEKRQLLRGEPTQIISDTERKRLNELLPALMAEANRRGVTIEGQVTEKVINAEPAQPSA